MTNLKNILSKYQGAKFEYDENQQREFISLADLEKEVGKNVVEIQAIYINTESKFGDQPVVYTKNYMVNMPSHLTPLATDLRQDQEVVEAINNRQIGFTIYSYNGKNGQGYSINLTPIEHESETSKGRAFNNDDVRSE